MAASATPAYVESLAEMFPTLSVATIRDVVEQCGNNCEVSLERLLTMSESPVGSSGGRPRPPAPMPQSRQATLSMLLPGSKSPSPTKPKPLAPKHHTHCGVINNDNSLAHLSVPNGSDSTATLANAQGFTQNPEGVEDICPWLATLDTGQDDGGMGGVPPHPASPARTSRGWWPTWPVSSQQQACMGMAPRPAACCLHATMGAMLPLPPPPCPASEVPYNQGSAAGSLLDRSIQSTPPRAAPLAAAVYGGPITSDSGEGSSWGASSLSDIPPGTPTLFLDDSLHPGQEASHAAEGEAVSPCPSADDQLAALMPHLAHCLASPSISGTSSPSLAAAAANIMLTSPTSNLRPMPAMEGVAAAATVASPASFAGASPPSAPPPATEDLPHDGMSPQAAAQQQQQGQGYTPEDLVQAVDFHLQMFTNLKREVVGDVLQRYSDAPQVALDQLIMLSSCVEHATVAAADDSSGCDGVPDQLSWEVGSGSSSDEEGSAAAGSSWGQALTPAELAAMEHGIFPADLAPPAAVREQAKAAQQLQERPLSPAGEDSLPAEEKLELLSRNFPSIGAGEVSGALEACDGSLFAAAELLRAFASEGEQQERLRSGSASASSVASGSASAPAAAAAVVPPEPLAFFLEQHRQEPQQQEAASHFPQHAQPKVQHLARRFPDAPAESLEVALQSCNYDLATARRTLREAGYTEVEVEPSQASQARPLPPPPSSTAAAAALPQPVPLPVEAAVPRAPLAAGGAAGLSLSEATYLSNQAIFEEERAQALRLRDCYRRCYELASAAHARGDHATANMLRQRGSEYRQQFAAEQQKAGRRISKRVNAGNMPVIKVDLHGLLVHEALETVLSGIRNLPESIPGGVVVRYITGKGLHSTGGAARIKPEVVRLLTEHGVPFVEGPGWVEATLVPATC